MKKSKKLLATVMAVAMVAGTAGCFGGGGGEYEQVTGSAGLSIMIQNAGYGYKWLVSIADDYEKETGIAVDVVPSALVGKIGTSMLSPERNNTDLYFNVGEIELGYIDEGPKAVKGYDKVFVDLSDLYNEKLEGYEGEVTLNNSLPEYIKKASTYFGDGKQYTLCWSGTYNSIVYNVDLFEKYNYTIPNTTNELIELCEKIKAGNHKSANNNTIYGFVFYEDYFCTDATVWMAQLLGHENYWKFEAGQNPEGVYTPDIYKSKEFFSGAQLMETLVSYNNGYANPNCTSYTFTQSQMKFLEGEAFMMPNGDWLEREMEASFKPGELNIKFMKQPINSELVDYLDTVETDAELSELITYIDNGKTGELSKAYSEKDIARVEEARNMIATQAQIHRISIPSYSDNIEGAKDFLRYLLSYEQQLKMLEKSYGNCVPINYDYSSTDVYKNLSTFSKSRFENIKGNKLYIGMCYFSPMRLRGGLAWYNSISETNLAIVPSSASHTTATESCLNIYNGYSQHWALYMEQSGVSNG